MAGISTLGQYLRQISELKTQQVSFTNLSQQLTSGKKTQNLSGLGNDIIRSMRSRTGVDSRNLQHQHNERKPTHQFNVKRNKRKLDRKLTIFCLVFVWPFKRVIFQTWNQPKSWPKVFIVL